MTKLARLSFVAAYTMILSALTSNQRAVVRGLVQFDSRRLRQSFLKAEFSSNFSPNTCLFSTSAVESTTVSSTDETPTISNGWLDISDLPKFKKIDPKDLTPAVDSVLNKIESEFYSLENKIAELNGNVAYDDVVPEVEKIQYPLGYVWGVAGHLNGVKNGEELRTAYEENQPKIIEVSNKIQQSKSLYDALQSISQKWKADESVEEPLHESSNFEENQRKRAVELSLRSMTLGGVGLTGDEKTRFNEIQMRLAALSTTFSNNVLDETKAFALTVTDSSKLIGVPESAKAMWANSYKQHIKDTQKDSAETTEDDSSLDPDVGPWRITLDGPSRIAVLAHVPDRAIREEVYMANIQRASEKNPEKSNIPLCMEILQLKQEKAKMLGFANYAELSLACKMAPSVDSVEQLADLILEKALPAAEKELAEITDYARTHGGDEYSESNLPKLMPWDISYWSERLKESRFNLTEEETRPYFALPAVLEGLFALVKRIFNVDVQAADGEADVWHPDVRFFKVYDIDTNKHVASFFLDPYSRPADKSGGAWMDVCIGKSAAVNKDVSVAYLVCNGSPPVGTTKPSLMTFGEVETLFHEFGHGLQHMLTKASVGDVAGINGVEWDAVELPSQFMENWCYDRSTVYGFAKHWETGEPMPEDMFEKLKLQKNYGAGLMACRQLLFGQLDMELHSNFDPSGAEGSESIFDVHRRMASKYTPFSLPLPEDRFLCTFTHIFSGGYSAGYYSYKWAEVMSADAFEAFEEVGLDNENAIKEVGMKFRNTVLSLGGGVDPMTVFKSFRGREPSPNALLRHNGLDSN